MAFLPLVMGSCSENTPPDLLPAGALKAYVGARFDLRLTAHDADGDQLTFSFACPTLPGLEDRAQILRVGGQGGFSWTPVAGDTGEHLIDFRVSDGQDSDLEVSPLTVSASTAPNSKPYFIKPLGDGETLDLAQKSCLELEVQVRDPDATSVAITQQTPIPGAVLQATGPFEATFDWCPTAEQAAQQRFVLVLQADDGVNELQPKEYVILIRAELPQDCPGQPPQLKHASPAPLTSGGALLIEAETSDDKGLKGPPVVYATRQQPLDPLRLDYGQMEQVTMTGGPSWWSAKLPNPALDAAPGEQRSLYYVIVAEDNDDLTGPCDHRTRLPADSLFELQVTRPEVTSCTTSGQCQAGQVCAGGSCADDACLPEDSDADGLYHEQSGCPEEHFCPSVGPALGPSHCAQGCSDNSDCQISGYACKVFDRKPGCGLAGSRQVGQACSDYTQCAGIAMCLTWPGGYCTISDCSTQAGLFSGPCPPGAACVAVADTRFAVGAHWICLRSCASDSDCRTAEGYSCQAVEDDLGQPQTACTR